MPALNSHSIEQDYAWLEPTWIVSDGDVLRGPSETFAVDDVALEALPPLTDSSSSSSNSRHSVPPVQMVDREKPDPQQSPHALLRSRLTAASWLMSAVLCFLFVYQFAHYQLTPRSLGAGTLIVTIGSAVLLSGKRELGAAQLRVLELAAFGITGAQLVSRQLEGMVQAAAWHNASEFIWSTVGGSMAFAVLILSYGMLMPNGWRRSALMLIPPAIAPVAALVFVRKWDPFAAQLVAWPRVCELAAGMVGAYAVAVFGTWTIANLRHEYRRALRFGQYRLRKRIGSGGMGEVYLAEHRLLKRPCALKLIRANQVNDPQSLIRFEREVRTTARLSHWNTVEIYDYGHTEDGTFYYVMEYLPGLNLSELVQRFGPLNPDRVVHFLLQTCDALIEAHAAGLIHRDLKPANIFASYRGGTYDVTKLLDFGLVVDHARPELLLTEDPQRVAPFAGSPLYMAPEQASGDLPPDPRSDLYSLGATGYCLLTGHPPFEGKTPLRLLMAHARDPVVPPSKLEPSIPDDLERIILRCLEKHPSRRYASIRELRQALARCSVAGKWTQERASQWWRLRAPALAAGDNEREVTTNNSLRPDESTELSRQFASRAAF